MKYTILFTALLAFILGVVVSSTPVQAQSNLLAPLSCQSPLGPFVETDGTHLTVNGSALKLRGYTFYPADDGGTAAWRSTKFQSYIDRDIAVGLSAGQNLIRPTDYWDKTNTAQTAFDPTIWANMDHLVCQAEAAHAYIILDLSAYKWLLMSEGQDPNNAANWTNFLKVIGLHYQNAASIAYYSISGEPSFPKTQAQDDTLVSFYQTVTNALAAADPNHLISAGGFNNMNNGVNGWWEPIYALSHNDVASFKTYSQHDINLMPSVLSYTHSIHKPAVDEEFGMPQGLGDSVYKGKSYNGIATSRAQFYQQIYSDGESLGVAGFVFWNLANLSGPSHYDVYPGVTPAVWAVVKSDGTSVTVSPPVPMPTETPVPPTTIPASTKTPAPSPTPVVCGK
jgi:hypothetical protein